MSIQWQPTDEDVHRAAEAIRAGIGAPTGASFKGASFSGQWTERDGSVVGYVGDAGTIFEDYARWVLETVGPIIERERQATA